MQPQLSIAVGITFPKIITVIGGAGGGGGGGALNPQSRGCFCSNQGKRIHFSAFHKLA